MCIHANGVACRNSTEMDDRCDSLPGMSYRECVVGTLSEDGKWICIVESNDEKQNGTFLPMTKDEDIFFKRITKTECLLSHPLELVQVDSKQSYNCDGCNRDVSEALHCHICNRGLCTQVGSKII